MDAGVASLSLDNRAELSRRGNEDRRGDAELRGGGALEELANSGQINGPVLARAFTYMHLHRLRLMEDEGTDARAVCFISARLRKVSGNGIGSPRELLDTEAGGKNQLRGRGASFTVINKFGEGTVLWGSKVFASFIHMLREDVGRM